MNQNQTLMDYLAALEERVKIAEAKAELAMQHSQILANIVKGESVCQALN